MIRLPTKAELRVLMSNRDPFSLTIYAPYIASNSNNNPNRIQLKDTLQEARRLLDARKLKPRLINRIIKPISQLIDSDEFRIRYPHSLAIFACRDFSAYYHLPPDNIKPLVAVSRGFRLQQAAQLECKNFNYYVLMLSYNGASLFRGDHYSLHRLKFEKVPQTMLQALNIDEFPNERQLHVVGPLANGRSSKHYHGQYNETQTNKLMLAGFFRGVDKKIGHHIKFKDRPLILAGVDYLLPIYRQVNTYAHLYKSALVGNFEHITLQALLAKVRQLLKSKNASTIVEA